MPTYDRILSMFPTDYNAGGNSGLSFNIDATGEKWAAGFIASESFTLAKVAVYIHSENGTSPAYTWRIETDNGSGRPSGTLAWANATVDVTVTAAGWTALQTLTASSAIAPGTLYHFVIQESGVAPDASNYVAIRENGQMSIPAASGSNGEAGYLACYASRNSGGWAAGSGAPVFVLSNSDSSVMIGQVSDAGNVYAPTNTAWKGVKIVAPASGTVFQAAIEKLNSTSSGAVACKLIDGSNNILTTGTISAGWYDVQTHRDYDLYTFDAPQSLTSGSTYRLVWKDPSAAFRFDAIQCTSATFKTLLPGIAVAQLTEGTSSDGTASPTSWTDSDDEIVKFRLEYSSISAGSSSGSQRVIGG